MFSSAHEEEVRDDTGVGDFGVHTSCVLIGVGFVNCVDGESGSADGVEPSSEGSAGVRNCERPVPAAQLFWCAAGVLMRSRYTSKPARENSTQAAALASQIRRVSGRSTSDIVAPPSAAAS